MTPGARHLPPAGRARVWATAALVPFFGGLSALAYGDLRAAALVAAVAIAAGGVLLTARLARAEVWRRREARLLRHLQGRQRPPRGLSAEGLAEHDARARTFAAGVREASSFAGGLARLPWYLVIGERGSGKTEALGRCRGRTTPGVESPLPGVGSTANMSWWLTDRAVCIDTRGTPHFPELPGAARGARPRTEAFEELAGFLAKYHPGRPLDGILLVVPADVVCGQNASPPRPEDAGGPLEALARSLGEELATVARALRKPVPLTVLLTKGDLIEGFRELSQSGGEGAETGEIFGFRPPSRPQNERARGEIARGLEALAGRLRRQTLSRVLELEESGEARDPAVAEAMCLFPRTLSRAVAPVLDRLVDGLLAGTGEGRRNVLLRGVFISSARGSRRPLCLDGLFREDVSREETAPSAARTARWKDRLRRVAAPLAGWAALAAIALSILVGGYEFRRTVGDERDFWRDVRRELLAGGGGEDDRRPLRTILGPRAGGPGGAAPVYDGGSILRVGGRDLAFYRLPAATLEWAVGPGTWPSYLPEGAPLRPVPESLRHAAHRSVFEEAILLPLLRAGLARLETSRGESAWRSSSRSTRALAALISLEAGRPVGPARLAELLGLALGPEERDKHSGHFADLARAASVTYLGEERGAPELLAVLERSAAGGLDRVIDRCLASAMDAWERFGVTGLGDGIAGVGSADVSTEGPLGVLLRIEAAGERFRKAEDALFAVGSAALTQEGISDTFATRWKEAFEAVRREALPLRAAAEELSRELERAPFEELARKAQEELAREALSAHALLLQAAGGRDAGSRSPPDDGTGGAARRRAKLVASVSSVRARARDEVLRLEKRLRDGGALLDARPRAVPPPGSPAGEAAATPSFATRVRVVALADRPDLSRLKGPDDHRADEDIRAGFRELEGYAGLGDADGRLRAAVDVARSVLRAKCRQLVLSRTMSLPRTVGELEAQLGALGAEELRLGPLPLSRVIEVPGEYRPDNLRVLRERAESVLELSTLAGLDSVAERSKGAVPGRAVPGRGADLRDAVRERIALFERRILDHYAPRYFEYWRGGEGGVAAPSGARRVSSAAVIVVGDTWQKYRLASVGLDADRANDTLQELNETRRAALEELVKLFELGVEGDVRGPGVTREEGRLLRWVRERQASLEEEARRLASESFRALCRDTVRAWWSLGADPHAARRSILSAEPLELYGRYTSVHGEGIHYWNALVESVLALLAESAERTWHAAVERLRKELRTFPLTEVQRAPVSRRTLAAVRDALLEAGISFGGDGGWVPPRPVSARGARPGAERLDALLSRLAGARIVPPRERLWLARAQALLDVLADPGLRAEIVVLRQTDPELRDLRVIDRRSGREVAPYGYRHRYLQVVRGGEPVGEPRAMDRAGGTGVRLLEDPHEPVAMALSQTPDSAAPEASIDLGASWAPMGSMRARAEQAIAEYGSREESLFKVPFVVYNMEEPAEPLYAYWIGFRFNRRVPRPEEWPVEADWPPADNGKTR